MKLLLSFHFGKHHETNINEYASSFITSNKIRRHTPKNVAPNRYVNYSYEPLFLSDKANYPVFIAILDIFYQFIYIDIFWLLNSVSTPFLKKAVKFYDATFFLRFSASKYFLLDIFFKILLSMKHSYQLTAKITLAVKNYLWRAYEVQELCNFAS